MYVITGQDAKGNQVWLADTDIDFDFTGEQMSPLIKYDVGESYKQRDYETIARKHEEIAQNAAFIKGQLFQAGKVVEVTFPLAFVETAEEALFNFPQHYTAKGKNG